MKPYYSAPGVTLLLGDCVEVMRTLPDASVDAIVSDPPYELGFMGKGWDASGIANSVEMWREAFRVLKPGGHLAAFGGTRTYHRMACAVEDAGFEIRDTLAWMYGCLSDDTEVLTTDGWVRYDRVNESQHALAFDTDAGSLGWERIRAVFRYPFTGQMVRLHSDATDQLLTPNHRVILEDRPEAFAPYIPSEQALRGLLTAIPRPQPLSEESGMAGRRYRVQEARELLGRPLPAGPRVGDPDGPQGRVRDGAPAPDGRALRVSAHAHGGGEPRGSRPDEQCTGQPDALADEPRSQVVRVGEDRGRGLLPSTAVSATAVDYAGVVWCINVPSGAFVARRNGLIFVTGNSGFPKSLDVSKAIDRAGGDALAWMAFAAAYEVAVEASTLTHADIDRLLGIKSSSCYWARQDHRGGMPPRQHWVTVRDALALPEHFERLYEEAEREVVGRRARGFSPGTNDVYGAFSGDDRVTAPATDAATEWSGWGTALKPAYEPIVLARKPLIGTVASNVQAHGTGALNIAATRIGTTKDVPASPTRNRDVYGGGWRDADGKEYTPDSSGWDANVGRWPANVLLDEDIEPLVRLRYTDSVSDSAILNEWCYANRHDLYAMRAGVPSVPVALDKGTWALLRETVLRALAEREPQRREPSHEGPTSLAGVYREDADGAASPEPERSGKPVMAWRDVHREGLSDGVTLDTDAGATGDSRTDDGDGPRLLAGASVGDGDEPQSPVAAVGGGASLQWSQDRQPDREPRTDDGRDSQAGASGHYEGTPRLANGERTTARTSSLVPLFAVPREWWHHFEPAGVGLRLGAAAMLDAQTGVSRDGVAVRRNGGGGDFFGGISPKFHNGDSWPDAGYGGSGGASRFFYTAKSSRSEREAGVEAEAKTPGQMVDRKDGAAGASSPRAGAGREQPQPDKLSAWVNAALTAAQQADTAKLLQRVIAEFGTADDSAWSMTLSGSGSTGQSPPTTTSTVSTASNSTTGSRTFDSSIRSRISASIRDAILSMESGIGAARTAVLLSRLTASIGISMPEAGPLTDAAHVISERLCEQSEKGGLPSRVIVRRRNDHPT